MQKIKKGDRVRVVKGSNRGKDGVVSQIVKNDEGIITGIVIDKINVHKKHQKPNQQVEKGGIVDISLPISVSNIALIDSKSKGKCSKIKFGYDKDNKKIRIAKLSNTPIDKK